MRLGPSPCSISSATDFSNPAELLISKRLTWVVLRLHSSSYISDVHHILGKGLSNLFLAHKPQRKDPVERSASEFLSQRASPCARKSQDSGQHEKQLWHHLRGHEGHGECVTRVLVASRCWGGFRGVVLRSLHSMDSKRCGCWMLVVMYAYP